MNAAERVLQSYKTWRIAMKKILRALAFASLAFSLSSTAQAQQAITADQLVGAWKLKSMVIHDASTTGEDRVGPLSIGYLTFVRDGKNLRASVNFSEPDRKQALGYATDGEAVQLFRSYNANSGIVELASAISAEGTPVTTTIDVDLDPHGIGPHPRITSLMEEDLQSSTSRPQR
jgi:Lipocalin-like domain